MSVFYKVKFKGINSFFWNTIRYAEGDAILEGSVKTKNNPDGTSENYMDYFIPFLPRRNIVDKDKNSFEINLNDNIVYFSSERPRSTETKKSRVKFNVKYKKVGSFFWKTIKNVTLDDIMYAKTPSPIKVFITELHERWEIPMQYYEFKFDKCKMLAIQDIMEQESGLTINAIK